jgi:hypothetical protein
VHPQEKDLRILMVPWRQLPKKASRQEQQNAVTTGFLSQKTLIRPCQKWYDVYMKSYSTNPVYFRLDTLLSLGTSQVHELARKAVGTLTSYRLVLGRCLLAMRESKGFKTFGCSSEIHYAITRLGLSQSTASACRRVARALTDLPELTLAAEQGTIEWSKLREITRKATPRRRLFG